MTDTHTTMRQGLGKRDSVLLTFVLWYLCERPAEIAVKYVRYASAFSESFSLWFMLKTLVAPWKSITDEYPDKGFNIEQILQTFFLNMTSRMMGLIIRTCAIVTGIAIQVIVFAGCVLYLALWLLFPVILLWSVIVLPFMQ